VKYSTRIVGLSFPRHHNCTIEGATFGPGDLENEASFSDLEWARILSMKTPSPPPFSSTAITALYRESWAGDHWN